MKLSRMKGFILPAIKNEQLNSALQCDNRQHATSKFLQCATGEDQKASSNYIVNRHLRNQELSLGMTILGSSTIRSSCYHPEEGKRKGPKPGRILSQVRHLSGISGTDTPRNGPVETSSLTSDNDKSFLYRGNNLLYNPRRTFLRPSLDSRQLGSVSLLEIKKFLRQKLVDFSESHACLCLRYKNI